MEKKSKTNFFETIVSCPDCGELNVVNSNTLYKKDMYTGTGYFLRVIFLECTKCGKNVVVQVDDSETVKIYRELTALIIKTFKKKMKNETISPKDIKKKDKLTLKLKRMRNDLKEKTAGLTLYDEKGNILIKGLTFSEEGDIIGNMQKM